MTNCFIQLDHFKIQFWPTCSYSIKWRWWKSEIYIPVKLTSTNLFLFLRQKKGSKRPLKDMHSLSGGSKWGYLDNTKKANIILFSISRSFLAILRQFRIISEDFRKPPTIPEDCQRFPKTNEEVRPVPKMSEEPSKHLTVFSSETVNIKKLTNLTANTKNYGQITLNAKPHSDPLSVALVWYRV